MDKAKKQRTVSLANFTRNYNQLITLIDDSSPESLVTPQYEKMKRYWEILEKAQDDFLEVTEIDIEEDKDGISYMDTPGVNYSNALKRYSDLLKTYNELQKTQTNIQVAEDRRMEEETRKNIAAEKKAAEDLLKAEELKAKFNSAKAELTSSIGSFNRLYSCFKDSVTSISGSDKRSEWCKLDGEFLLLKKSLSSLASIDQSQTPCLEEMKELFVKDAETLYIDIQKWVLSELKDHPSPDSIPSSTSSPSSGKDYTTKKESVCLPMFKGEENEDPYLQYPIWRKQWDLLIVEYHEKFRFTMLDTHIDKAAKEQFVGFENNYDEALRRLDAFYGDPSKVVACVMSEVMTPSVIKEGDYKSLIDYSKILRNNYHRLENLELEHEMSNKSAMSLILKKFPRVIAEKWTENLTSQNLEVKKKPFPHFIKWLDTQKAIWEELVSAGFSEIGNSQEGSAANAFFSNSQSKGLCFGCGGEGHKKFECPNKKPLKVDETPKFKKAPPKVKKFWCAYHKGDVNHNCQSISCQDLRKMSDVTMRIQLLKENGDCPHCCDDHKPEHCKKKSRICGGGRDNRGCAQGHNLHELFCVEAQVFHAAVYSASSDSPRDGVVLLIMSIRTIKGYSASVFWDNGSSSNFIREAFARMCGFKGREETLCVTSLGGVVTDYHTVITYSCSLRTVNGEWVKFEAYGIEHITGALTQIKENVIRELFPQLDGRTLKSLKRAPKVDILMGFEQPSWFPDRGECAKGGQGDLWLYRSRFGSCIGGRHPLIKEETKKSDSLFTVNHTYHANVSVLNQMVHHELEFCMNRSASYFQLKTGDEQSSHCAHNLAVNQEDSVPPSNVLPRTPVTGPKTFTIPAEPSIVTTANKAYVLRQDAPVFKPSSLSQFVMDVSVEQDVLTPIKNNSYANDLDLSHCFAVKTAPTSSKEIFFHLESLGTLIEPQCGGCKCSKCPIPGSKFSFTEQKEFDTIKKNLRYDLNNRRWFCEYPWITPRSALPRNLKQAFQCLRALENRLSKDLESSKEICEQIQAMVDTKSAIILSDEEVLAWDADYYYLPVVAVKEPKKNRMRVCFDASRKVRSYPSMNSCLMKGPDRFINDLLSVVLAFRNGRVGCAADITKFHHQVYLIEKDVHMQRFLWRGMNDQIEPQTYAVRVNNFGVRAANSIATIALHNSADEFASVYPIESQEVKDQTYVDDELTAALDMEHAHLKTDRWDEICYHAGMPNKGWTYSGDESSGVEIGSGGNVIVKVLGFSWIPRTDIFVFNVCVKLAISPGGSETNIETVSQLESLTDQVILNRRSLLSNVNRIFDPAGLVAPFILPSKLLMRHTWSNKSRWDWDDDLPDEERQGWLNFLKLLLCLNKLSIPRSLWPVGDVIGRPILVIFSDGSISAYGVAAYIRWQLVDGSYWTRLIMAKSKISPKHIASVPRMELCGAVLGNLVKNFLLKETKYDFAKVYNLVDSSTVLGYINKEYGSFGPYEGVKIAEIQTSNEVVNGQLKGWAWIAGYENPADWCTKPRTATDIGKDFFYLGAPFLLKDESKWPIKWSYKTTKLEGEIERKSTFCTYTDTTFPDFMGRLIERASLWKKMVRVLCWIHRLGQQPSVNTSGPLNYEELKRATIFIVKYAQLEITSELSEAMKSGTGRFRKLAPSVDADGVWRVGSRMKHLVPFTKDSMMPKILPTKHRVTLLIMQFCHEFSHAGQDGTLSRFRMLGYWAVRAGHLAKHVKEGCITCRMIAKVLLNQPMGQFPDEMFLNPIAWGHVQLDLFGFYNCRGDVNPRTTKKTWGMIIVDCNSGAVHLDIVQDYSTHAVLLSLRRFGSLRGWPGIIYSDPGSQLEAASGRLESWWVTMGESLRIYGSSKNLKWKVSPPDSPWRQGKAERLIAIVKKQIHISVGDTRVSPVELQTIFMEIANICNERPIGLSKPREDGTYNIITPNQLLLGRSTNILPDDTELVESLPMQARYRLVQHVTTVFWKRWATEVSPGLVNRPVWHKPGRNLCVGDVILICQPSAIKGKYRLGVVDDVETSTDGFVRTVTVRYVLVSADGKVRIMHIRRSVQRLVLILPIEEQSTHVEVKEHEHFVECCTSL